MLGCFRSPPLSTLADTLTWHRWHFASLRSKSRLTADIFPQSWKVFYFAKVQLIKVSPSGHLQLLIRVQILGSWIDTNSNTTDTTNAPFLSWSKCPANLNQQQIFRNVAKSKTQVRCISRRKTELNDWVCWMWIGATACLNKTHPREKGEVIVLCQLFNKYHMFLSPFIASLLWWEKVILPEAVC